MDAEATDLDAMPARDGFHQRRLARDFDELLARVAVLVEGSDVARCHGVGEGDVDRVLVGLGGWSVGGLVGVWLGVWLGVGPGGGGR